MTKSKTTLYSMLMLITFIGELVFLIVALTSVSYMLLIGTGVFYLVQSGIGAYMLYEAAFKHQSESAYSTMAFGMMIPFAQALSGYFLYRVRKGE